MPKLVYLNPNEKIGNWTYLKEITKSKRKNKSGEREIICACICNNTRILTLSEFKTNKRKSCGCQNKRYYKHDKNNCSSILKYPKNVN